MATVLGILGSAGIAQAAVLRPALRRGDVVVAIASRRDARRYADRFGIERAYDSRGERGVLHVDNLVFPSQGHSIATDIDGVPRRRTVAGEETYDHQLATVVDALASGEPLPTEGRDPVGNMRVIDAVYAAAVPRR